MPKQKTTARPAASRNVLRDIREREITIGPNLDAFFRELRDLANSSNDLLTDTNCGPLTIALLTVMEAEELQNRTDSLVKLRRKARKILDLVNSAKKGNPY